MFAHLVDARQDRPAALVETAPGRYEGGVTLPDGVWSLHLDLSRSGEVVYRSRNRLSVR